MRKYKQRRQTIVAFPRRLSIIFVTLMTAMTQKRKTKKKKEKRKRKKKILYERRRIRITELKGINKRCVLLLERRVSLG